MDCSRWKSYIERAGAGHTLTDFGFSSPARALAYAKLVRVAETAANCCFDRQEFGKCRCVFSHDAEAAIEALAAHKAADAKEEHDG